MAHYAVTKHGEHDPGCRYDFKNRAERLIQDSRSGSSACPLPQPRTVSGNPDSVVPRDLAAHADSGVLRPVVDSVHRLAEVAAAAHQVFERGGMG